jgi:two-component system, chemotaxis family, CheB/CheR fusion protein
MSEGPDERDAKESAVFHVVGVGASAGGLESLERLFSHLPTDTGMAFVVLQHLSPDFKSLMDELLARRTAMPVQLAEDGLAVEANCVYLLPPMKEMVIRERHLVLSDRDPRQGLAMPIDLFFRSLAHDLGERAIAVVLSGSGSDGSRGIKEVRRAGGVVFCESPETAAFNGMPLSALATGTVDQVLAPEEIADAIARLARPGVYPTQTADVGPDGDDDDVSVTAILRLLRDEYGIDFSHYKTSTVTRRIERRLALNRSGDLAAYIDALRADPRELNSLYEDLLIGVTRFFRDDAAFQALEERIIPEIIDRAQKEEPDGVIRVWVPGCATGQEAYSIAMLLHEQLAVRRRAVNVKILATDVHKSSLEVASAGVYAAEQVAGISPQRLERFFTLKPNGYQISQTLRESIVFAPHNLIRDAPFTRLDLVACRNLLIYFQPATQKTVLTLFHFALRTGGFMFLGSSESPGGLLDEFDTIDEHAKIYRKRRDIGLPRDLKLPLPRAHAAPRLAMPALSLSSGVSPQLLSVYDRLLDRFMPPSFLVDDNGQLIDSFGSAETILKVGKRRPSQNVLDMLDDELRTVVSGALHRVKKEVTHVRYDGIPIPGMAGRYSMTAEPIRDARAGLSYVLLSLAGVDGAPPVMPSAAVSVPATPAASLDAFDVDDMNRDQMTALRDELFYTKENLQSAIQELETTNEELQATNEELVASNEELQSTNEELHSVNEELYTVNAEYQKKNVELQQLNGDIEHLLEGTDVATLFLDRELCIRRFTSGIEEVFHVIAHDIGRPIQAFSHELERPTLWNDMNTVLQTGTSIEAQTWDTSGRCYFLRVLPYRARTQESGGSGSSRAAATAPPDGVVLTLTDISALEQARARVAQLSAIVESSDDAIISAGVDGRITSWNDGATRLYGYLPEEAHGQPLGMLLPENRRADAAAVLAELAAGRSVERQEAGHVRKDGSLLDVSVTFSPMFGATGSVAGVSAIARDIAPLVAARRRIADSEERIRLLLDSTAEAIYGTDLSGVCTFCNLACARLLGYDSPAALIGRQMHPLIHHTRRDGTPYPPERSPIYEAMRHREQAHVDDEVLWRADGTSFPAEYWSHPIVRGDEVIGAVVTFLDITERRQAEEEIQEGVRRREQFLAMLSHELRNPLAAILSATRLLGQAEWGRDDACREAGSVVERQAKHMTRLLDDLLDVSRITRGRIVLRAELLDLRDTARSAIEALGPLFAEHDTRLTVDIPDEPLPVIGDAARLHQIQANLLSNASKYTRRGGHVRFQLAADGRDVRIQVSDDGRGIDPALLPKIFDLFVQGDQSIARSEGGLGIGLTLLRSLVELHDGRVEARSDGRGRGSTFTVWLPLAPAQAGSEVAEPATHSTVKTVVVVEDQPDARRMLQLLLESLGLQVWVADNGENGAALIERLRPDVAIVDLGLPVMSGFDVARRLRQNPLLRRTRLIALSGYGQDADIQESLDAGFDEHLTKPPDPERLEALLGV